MKSQGLSSRNLYYRSKDLKQEIANQNLHDYLNDRGGRKLGQTEAEREALSQRNEAITREANLLKERKVSVAKRECLAKLKDQAYIEYVR